MDRVSMWIEGQIVDHLPEHSDNKQSVGVLADACATLSGKGSLVFGMSMPPDLATAGELYARACAALATWFPKLEQDEAEQLAARIRTQGLDVPIPIPVADQSGEGIASICERLRDAREESLRRLGVLIDSVLARSHPIQIDGALYCWPANAIGAQRLVRKPQTVLLVTDGLSNPWDPSLHVDVPDWTFGFELAIEVPLSAFADATDRAIASSWAPVVLWAATDWIVAERANLLERVENLEVITHAIPPVAGLEHLVASNGFMGGLIGMPYAGNVIGTFLGHGSDPHSPGITSALLTMKLLTADEYEWALGVTGPSRARALAELFLHREERHISWPNRPSASFPAT